METKTKPKVTPRIAPEISPDRRYNPDDDHCGGQWQRTIRRIREI